MAMFVRVQSKESGQILIEKNNPSEAEKLQKYLAFNV